MKKVLLLVICFLFVEVGSISAQTQTSSLLEKDKFELGPEISYITYKEPGLKTKGFMYGLAGSYTYHNKIMLRVELKGSYGTVDFAGSTLARTRVSVNNNPNGTGEIRGLGGYDFPVLKSSVLTPYIGIGVRYLNNDVLLKPYERESYYIYSPIGIGFVTGLGKGWSIGGTGEYDHFWWGYQTSHPIDDLPNLRSDIVSYQKNGYGLRGSMTLEKRYKKVILEGGPFVRYWNIKKLRPEIVPDNVIWQEPGNNSTEVGLKLAVKF